MRLLVDMNLSPRWVPWLNSAGHDAAHWSEIGKGDAPDQEIMDYARQHGFVVLSHDLDFGDMLAASQAAEPSLVQIRADNTSPEMIGAQVLAALLKLSAEISQGALVVIEPSRSRVRLLPLHRTTDAP